MEQQIIPKGYKHSEFGPIPNEWNCFPLSHFINQLVAGISVNSVETDDVSGQKCVLKTSCIYHGVFTEGEAKLIAPKDLWRAKLNPVKGAILVSRMNTPALVGEIGYIDKDYDDRYLPDRLWKTTFKRNVELDSKWLSYCLSYKPVSQIIKETATGTSDSMKNISKGSFLSVVVPTPTYEEQTAIADALSDVDTLIASIEKLIAKKQAIKTATMQQLLTGKKRLPPFDRYPNDDQEGVRKGTKITELGEIPEDWEVKRVGDIVEQGRLPSGLYKDKNLYGQGTPIIKLGDVFGLDEFFPQRAQRVVTTKDELKSYEVKLGDIYIALASVKLEGVGKVMIVNELAEPTVFDHNVALIRSLPNYNCDFLSYVFKSNVVRNQVAKGATQVGTTFLKASTILGFIITCPKIEEQAAIAQVILSMDKDIDCLEKRLAKTQQIKQGMMQELLTGKTRLI